MEHREKILKAAARVYADLGFRGATTRRIAQEAGVNEVTLFRHFGSKAVLLHEAVHAAGLFPESPSLPENPVDPRAELLQYAIAHHAELVAKRSLIRTCFGECEEHPDILLPGENTATRSRDNLQRYLGTLRHQRRVRDDLDLHSAAMMLNGVLFADAIGRDILPVLFAHEPPQAIARYIELFVHAIGLEANR